MNHDEAMQVLRAGTLQKRGTHKNDDYHARSIADGSLLLSYIDFDVHGQVCLRLGDANRLLIESKYGYHL